MLPLKDNIRRSQYSWAVVLLCIVMLLVNLPIWFSGKQSQNAIDFNFGFVPLEFAVRPWISFLKMISATFLHGDIVHLAGNCLFLWVFGRSLEALFGSLFFLAVFPMLGISGFVLHWALYPDSIVPVIGASAAISTILGAYLSLFPTAHIKTVLPLAWFIRVFDVPAWVFLIYWGCLQILSVTFSSSGSDNIAYAAHIGGFILGIVAAIVWKVLYPSAEEKLIDFINVANHEDSDTKSGVA